MTTTLLKAIASDTMDNENLGKDIKASKYILAVVLVMAILSYTTMFWGSPAEWGQFGDYLGGLMNPLIAFGAFYWLATSVLLQKTELAETRAALIAGQRAQRDQADTALVTARIQSVNIRLASVSNHANQVRARLALLLAYQGEHGIAKNYWDESGSYSRIGAVIVEVQNELSTLIEVEVELLNEIDRLGAQLEPNPYQLGRIVGKVSASIRGGTL